MKNCVEVDQVSKVFRIYSKPRDRFLEIFSLGGRQRHIEKWALKNISFDLKAGESLALVGDNGSGKSTLLSIIVGSRAATDGVVRSHGRVAALLELGMGFNPDFSGRQNAITGLQILGTPPAAIPELVDRVESFSELGDYFDQPVRTYSSGMQVRLGFSVATVHAPDILIVDEALSVGDAYFQHKSVARIRELRDGGCSLLFVSHDPGAVKSLCDRAILLENGCMQMDGSPAQVMDYYNAMVAQREADWEIKQVELGQTRSGSHEVEIVSASMNDASGNSLRAFKVGEQVQIACMLAIHKDVDLPTVGISIKDRLGYEVFGTNTEYLGVKKDFILSSKRISVSFDLPLNLGIGSYSVTVAVHSSETHLEENYDWWDQACVFDMYQGAEFQFQGTSFLPVEASYKSEADHE